jgi:hypothetical protein
MNQPDGGADKRRDDKTMTRINGEGDGRTAAVYKETMVVRA